MWINTIAKKFIDGDDDKLKNQKFKCPLSHGWIFGNNKKGDLNFIPLLFKYLMRTFYIKPYMNLKDDPKRFNKYKYINHIEENVTIDEIEECINNRQYNELMSKMNIIQTDRDYYWYKTCGKEHITVTLLYKVNTCYKLSINTILYDFMKQYDIKTIYFYDSPAEKIYFKSTNENINLMSILPFNIIQEINTLSKYITYFNLDGEISADFENEYLITNFTLNPNKFCNSYIANHDLTFLNMFKYYTNVNDRFEGNLYCDMINLYSNHYEFVDKVIIPCKNEKEKSFYIECYEEAFNKIFDIRNYI